MDIIFFPFNPLNSIPLNSGFHNSDAKSAQVLSLLLYTYMPLLSFKISSLYLMFRNVSMMHLDVWSVRVNTHVCNYSICWASWTCCFRVSIKYGKFSVIFSSNNFSLNHIPLLPRFQLFTLGCLLCSVDSWGPDELVFNTFLFCLHLN